MQFHYIPKEVPIQQLTQEDCFALLPQRTHERAHGPSLRWQTRRSDAVFFFSKAKAAPLHYQLSISKSTQDCNYGFLLAAHCLRYHQSHGKAWVLPTLRIQLGIKTSRYLFIHCFPTETQHVQ